MNIRYIYYFAALENSESSKLAFEMETLRTSVESLKAVDSKPELLLITNSAVAKALEPNEFESIIIDDSISQANLDYKRVLHQKDIIRNEANKDDCHYLAFVDHDTLFSSDIAPFFFPEFDFAVTANFSTRFDFDSFHLPQNTGVASINAGVQLCKPSSRSVLFMDEKLAICRWADKNRAIIPTPLNSSPLSWGCDQISMMRLLNKEIFINHRRCFEVGGATVRVFSTNTLNFSPDLGREVMLAEFYEHYIWHFKGNRKPYMKRFWEALKAAGMIELAS
jgi:hypothetical protein